VIRHPTSPSTTSTMPRVKFEVTGKVTGRRLTRRLPLTCIGVFFRVGAVKKATSLGVTGWIRNTPQHSVQGEAQHNEQSQLDKFTHVRVSQPSLLMWSGLAMRDLLGARLINVSLRRFRRRGARPSSRRSRVTTRPFIDGYWLSVKTGR